MIYFGQRSAAQSEAIDRSRTPHPDAEARSIVARYENNGRGYLLKSMGGLSGSASYKFIRIEPGVEDFHSTIYGSKLKALDGIFYDRLSQPWGVWGERWIEDLVLAIAALQPLTESCAHGRATARFAKRQLAVYGDSELGYLIGQNLRGRYRFVYYCGSGEEVSSSFRSEAEALRAAADDCARRDRRHWGMPWAAKLIEVTEAAEREEEDDLPLCDDELHSYDGLW